MKTTKTYWVLFNEHQNVFHAFFTPQPWTVDIREATRFDKRKQAKEFLSRGGYFGSIDKQIARVTKPRKIVANFQLV